MGLARWVLDDDQAWSEEAIRAAMHGSANRPVRVPRAVDVIVTYSTASVAADGTVMFAADIYRRDAALEAALGRAGR